MADTLKMTREDVEHFLSEMNQILDVAESDLAAFEKINDRVLTEQNCSASRKIKSLKDTNNEAYSKRKSCIADGIENLKEAKRMLTEYAEAVDLT